MYISLISLEMIRQTSVLTVSEESPADAVSLLLLVRTSFSDPLDLFLDLPSLALRQLDSRHAIGSLDGPECPGG